MDINSVTIQKSETPGSSGAGLTNLAENFDNFLTILTTQLQNQDPLSPLESNEFTNQLVQFTGVEQQVLQNKNLEKLIELQDSNQALSAVSFIGKIVEATGNTTTLTDGEATFSYSLPKEASAAAIKIFNSSGELVFQQPAEKGAGLHDFVWNGDTLQGGKAPNDAAYSFSVSAVDKDDATIDAVLRVIGLVTGISIENGKTLLGLGDVGVPLDAVTGIKPAPVNTTDLLRQG
jgi:flagellar basal-body rod modification protein FlgD